MTTKQWTIVTADGILQTKCPHCEATGTVEEVDTSTRWNSLVFRADGKSAVAHTGESLFESDGWICSSCLSRDLVEPVDFHIADWV